LESKGPAVIATAIAIIGTPFPCVHVPLSGQPDLLPGHHHHVVCTPDRDPDRCPGGHEDPPQQDNTTAQSIGDVTVQLGGLQMKAETGFFDLTLMPVAMSKGAT
jgi:hypothetical protein